MQNKDNTKNNGDTSTNFKIDIDTNLSKGDVLSRYYSNKHKHMLYGFVSFLMTAAFYVIFISPSIEQVFTDAFDLEVSAWVWAVIGLLFSVVITILIMHSHTSDRPQSKYVAYGLIIVLGLVFNMFTEVSSTSDRVQERVTIKSENSALFKALTEKAKHSTGQANTSLTKARNDYADALSTMKARCKKGNSYNKRLCTKWTMRADEYKTAMELHKGGATSELQETVRLAKEASHNTEYAQMTIQLVMEQMDVSFKIATMLVSLFIIFTLEVLGAMIGYDYRRYRDALPHYGVNLNQDKELDHEIKELEREVFADEKRMDAEIKQLEVDLLRHKKEAEHYAKADKIKAELEKFKESLFNQASPSAGSAKVSPDDNNLSPIPDAEVQKLRAEIDRLKAENIRKESSTMDRQNELDLGGDSDTESDNGKASLSGLQSAGSVTVSNNSVTASSEESTESDKSNDSESDKKGLAESERGEMIIEASVIYHLWKKAMISGSCNNTITGGRKWIRSGKKSGLLIISKTNDSYVSTVLNALYEMAVSDDWMKHNPEWKQGKRVSKYLFV